MNLQEIKEREAKATPGPWEYLPGEFNYDDGAENRPGSIHQVETGDNRGWWIAAIEELFEGQTLANADFIAHAREDIPALVAEVERLRKEISIFENKEFNIYLDKELEIERLQTENEQLKERQRKLYTALQNIINCFSESDIEFLFDEDTTAMNQLLVEVRIAVNEISN